LECLREARRHNGFSWSLKGRVDPALYDRIEEALRVSEEDES
jgi:ribosomal protein L7Ae family protein